MEVLQSGGVWLRANMRTFLHKLMVDITRNPRQIVTPEVDFKWEGGNSRIWQIFRAYEYLFGRRLNKDGSTQRFEGTGWSENGKEHHVFGTWENLFVFGEHIVRLFLKGFIPKFEIVRLPQLVTSNGIQFNSPFRFAIAFDATNVAAATSVSLTVTGSNMFLFGCGGYSATAGAMSGAFNSVAMTAGTTQIWIGSSNPINGLYLIAPATGTHTLAITNGNGGCAIGITYSGVAQVTPDQYVTTSGTSGTSTATVTSATANCWMVMFVIGANNTPAAGTNATARSLNTATNGLNSIFDSNGNIATGSFAMSATGLQAGPGDGNFAYKFAQVTVAAVKSGFFFLVPH